jgi:hypothetical protein
MPRQIDSSLLNAQVTNNPLSSISSGSITNILQEIEQIPEITLQAIESAVNELLGLIDQVTGLNLQGLATALEGLFGGGGGLLSGLLSFILGTGTTTSGASIIPAVKIDASSFGSIATGSPTSLTVAHTCVAPPNTELVVYVNAVPLSSQTYSGGTTATYDGVAMAWQGAVNVGDASDGWLEVFTLNSPAAGTNNLVVTPPAAVASIEVSVTSYTGCSGVSGFASAASRATSQSLTVQTVANGLASVGFASTAPINQVLSGATTRSLQNTPAGKLIVGDAPGGAAVTVTASAQLLSGTATVTPTGTGAGVLGLHPSAAESVTPSVATTDVVAISGTGAGTIPVTPVGGGGGLVAPVFDAKAISSASGAQTNTLGLSWTHPVGVGAQNCGIIAVIATNNGSSGFVPSGTPTASIGGTPLTYLGSVLLGNVAIGGFIAVWAVKNVPTGSQTATFGMTDTGQGLANAYGVSFTYTGVTSIGTLQTLYNTNGTTQSPLSVSSAVNHLVWGLVGNYQASGYTSPTFTSRENQNGLAPFFDAGDMAGASSVSVGATQSSTSAGAIVGLDLT